MKIAYLVLAHSDPSHLKRLIERISTKDSRVFVHLDKKSEFAKFQHLQNERTVFLKNRTAVYWGDFSQVQAILGLLDTALSSQFDTDRLVLLSGADYPIKPIDEIESFFATNRAKEFLNAVRMPADAAGKPIARLNNYVIRPTESRPTQFLKRAARKVGLIPRQRDHAVHLKGLMPFGGSTWWAITREAGDYILEFVRTRPDVVDFFKHVEFPDEAFFQTVLMNSKFAENVVRNLTYTDWSAGGSSPSIMSEKHLPMFETGISFGPRDTYGDGPALFARKFKDGQDRLLDSINSISATAISLPENQDVDQTQFLTRAAG